MNVNQTHRNPVFSWVLAASICVVACNHSRHVAMSPGFYKGRLEVKGGCMNYTIAVLDGNMDTALVTGAWTDPTTGKIYKNVFALGSRCTFPDNLNEGDTFSFTIDNTTPQNCAVCMMYYPVPPRHLSIKVLPGQ